MDQVLRINFLSGKVAERRGDDETVFVLYDADVHGLIDYVQSINLENGEVAFFTREIEDCRFDNEIVITTDGQTLT